VEAEESFMQGQDDDSRDLTGLGKYVVAGLGAASSLLVPLYFVDLEIIVSNLRITFASDYSGVLLIIAYLIRFSLFVAAGVFWIWAFNRSERNAWKIFQLGIVAPAILTGADQSEQRNDLLDAARQVQQSSYLLMSPAFADEAERAIRDSEPSPIESLSWWEVVRSGFLVEPLDDPVRRLVQETEDARELTNVLEAEISTLSEEKSNLEGLNEDLRETISNMEESNQILTNRNQT
jgi:hypothetical protein